MTRSPRWYALKDREGLIGHPTRLFTGRKQARKIARRQYLRKIKVVPVRVKEIQ